LWQIGHNGKGAGAGWHLGHVEISNDATQKIWYFPCSKWFDKSEEPRQLVQILPVAERDAAAATAEYKVRHPRHEVRVTYQDTHQETHIKRHTSRDTHQDMRDTHQGKHIKR
jgi:hypothetical protein